MLDVVYREQFLDAANSVVTDQERAGLDILTNGDYHIDGDVGGGSWVAYPVQRVSGVSPVALERSDFWRFVSSVTGALDPAVSEDGDTAFPVGSWLSEIVSAWRYPSVVDRVGSGVPPEFAKIWRIAQSFVDRPVKFGTVSADIVGGALTLHTDVYADDKRELMWDLATVINAELRELAAAGCRAIQIEDPVAYYLASLGADEEALSSTSTSTTTRSPASRTSRSDSHVLGQRGCPAKRHARITTRPSSTSCSTG